MLPLIHVGERASTWETDRKRGKENITTRSRTLKRFKGRLEKQMWQMLDRMEGTFKAPCANCVMFYLLARHEISGIQINLTAFC